MTKAQVLMDAIGTRDARQAAVKKAASRLIAAAQPFQTKQAAELSALDSTDVVKLAMDLVNEHAVFMQQQHECERLKHLD